MSINQPKIMTLEARCGVRLDYVLFPIDFRELLRVLAKNGYELSRVGRVPPAPARISFSGDIARKGETQVIVESDSGEIGVVGRSLPEAKASFGELANIIKSELGISLNEKVRFYWCIVHYNIDTGKTPLKQIAKTGNKDYMSRFNKVLGEDLSLFSVRIAPKDLIPNHENWFDIAIEPAILNANLYHIGVVFRNRDKEKAETFVRDLENNLLKLLKIIEA